LYII